MSQAAQVCVDSRQRVTALVTTMAGMVEGAVDGAIEALVAGDLRLAQAVLQKETVVNCMEMHIDAVVLAHLAQKNLPEEDVRSLGFVLNSNKHLERIGDLAAMIGGADV
jgi:phosphate transport system protein